MEAEATGKKIGVFRLTKALAKFSCPDAVQLEGLGYARYSR
jgi:hypothetical protein